MKTPKFLHELINDVEYADKNSDTYVRATKYMNLLYPGQVEFDETGKMTVPHMMGKYLKTWAIYQKFLFIRIVVAGWKNRN